MYRQSAERGGSLTDILYNGICGREIGVFVAHRPNIPSPQPQYTALSIPGRDGSVVHKDGSYDDISIDIVFHFATKPFEWQDTARAMRNWLLCDSDPRLILADDGEWFYKVKLVTISDISRELAAVGKATATFLCEPHKYLVQGTVPRESNLCRYNSWATCHPVYCIQASGACRLTVNGSVDINHTGTIYLDSDLMIAYDTDGKNLNACVSGDYESLWLKPGYNTIIATGFGSIGNIVPNWRAI